MTALNVAIAEDNPKTMELLNDMLKNEDGIEVVGNAENGEDAYQMIVNSKPDVVLLDVIMPGMDGVEVMEKVKQEGNLEKNPCFIMVTAAGSDAVTSDAFRMGASYFIMKPFKKEVLVDKIHRIANYGLKPRGLNLAAGAVHGYCTWVLCATPRQHQGRNGLSVCEGVIKPFLAPCKEL